MQNTIQQHSAKLNSDNDSIYDWLYKNLLTRVEQPVHKITKTCTQLGKGHPWTSFGGEMIDHRKLFWWGDDRSYDRHFVPMIDLRKKVPVIRAIIGKNNFTWAICPSDNQGSIKWFASSQRVFMIPTFLPAWPDWQISSLKIDFLPRSWGHIKRFLRFCPKISSTMCFPTVHWPRFPQPTHKISSISPAIQNFLRLRVTFLPAVLVR